AAPSSRIASIARALVRNVAIRTANLGPGLCDTGAGAAGGPDVATVEVVSGAWLGIEGATVLELVVSGAGSTAFDSGRWLVVDRTDHTAAALSTTPNAATATTGASRFPAASCVEFDG